MEMKRLNVVSGFEARVLEEFKNNPFEISRYLAVALDVRKELYQCEKDYIEETFRKKKAHHSEFVSFVEMGVIKPQSRFNPTINRLKSHLLNYSDRIIPDDALIFVVIRDRF
jgi:hypothetical protein